MWRKPQNAADSGQRAPRRDHRHRWSRHVPRPAPRLPPRLRSKTSLAFASPNAKAKIAEVSTITSEDHLHDRSRPHDRSEADRSIVTEYVVLVREIPSSAVLAPRNSYLQSA